MKEEELLQLIAGQLSLEEKKERLARISESPETREEYYHMKNVWALVSQSHSNFSAGEEDLSIFRKNIRQLKLKVFRTRAITAVKYAAVVFLTLLLGKMLFQNTAGNADKLLAYNEISVPAGQVAEVTLSDGTRVFINSCSSLKYPSKFNANERRVFLAGEAYFEVTKGHLPFLVESHQRVVKVLGTKFNVMAYPNDTYYQATLKEGKIALLDSTGNTEVQLKAGEQYSLNLLSDNYLIHKVNTRNFDSWKDGIYVFDHETLGGIAERLQRTFAIKITILDKKISKYKFSGTITRNVPFEQLLKIIQASAPIKYKLKESNGAIEEAILY